MLTYEMMKKLLLVLAVGVLIGVASSESGIEREVEIKIPAVNEQGNGFLAVLTTIAKPASTPGNGIVSVDINDVVSRADTQISARTAVEAANNYLNGEVSNWDIIYSIDVNANVIEGTSAGAAMAISTIAAIQNIQLSDNISITGTINENGNIGQIGSVYEKAKVSSESGVDVFFVPSGQNIYSSNVRNRECDFKEGIELCKIFYFAQNSGEELGIEIVEVENIREVIDYLKN